MNADAGDVGCVDGGADMLGHAIATAVAAAAADEYDGFGGHADAEAATAD